MPRRGAQGGGTIRQRSDGRWEARYTIGRDPGTGKQVQKSIYGETQAEVRKKLQQATTAIDEGVYTEPSKMTVGGWLDVWIKEYTGDLKPYTLKSYTGHVNNHIKPSLGAVKLSALNAPTMQAFINSLQREGLAPKSVKNNHGTLHKALQQAVELSYLRANPASACKLPRVERTTIKPLEDDTIASFLRAIKGHQYETLYMVDLFTGMRQGEILGLTWDCIDFKAGTIHLYRQLTVLDAQYSFASLKNGKTRRIAPPPSVMKALQEHRRKQLQWRVLAGSAWSDSGLVFTNEIGGHLTHSSIYKRFKEIIVSIGCPDTRFHDLRHSFAVMALQNGLDIKSVQESLGHYSAAFTLDVYGHVTDRMITENAERMERFLRDVSKL